MPTPSETLRIQRELASGARNKVRLVSRNKVPLPNGWVAYIDKTHEFIRSGSWVGLREELAKLIKQKKLDISDQVAYLDMAVCEGIKRVKGSYHGYCSAPIQGSPSYQLVQKYHQDPRGPKGLKRGQHGRDALAWKALALAALDGKLNSGFMDDFTRQIGCGSCKAEWKTILRQMPPNYSSPDAAFEWQWRAHNRVNKKLGKPEITLEEAKQIWST